jgi:hypothetical protein
VNSIILPPMETYTTIAVITFLLLFGGEQPDALVGRPAVAGGMSME